MDVAKTVEEARLLYESGLKESALRSLLLAVAATARKRYPRKKYGDEAAFTSFVLDEMLAGRFFGPCVKAAISMRWKGLATPLETIIYELRCTLVHESEMHEHVLYDPHQDPTRLVLRTDADGRLVFQDSLLVCLFKCIHNAQENADLLTPIPFSNTTGGHLVGNREGRLIVGEAITMPLP